jgi:hypothetical protein
MDLEQMDFIRNCTKKYQDCKICIVASHSCDIARSSDKEPNIEVFPCHVIPELNNANIKGRNVRIINFEVEDNSTKKFYCLYANEKLFVDKSDVNQEEILENIHCNLPISSFQNWLSSRYKRQVLPDNVNHRINNELRLRHKIKKFSNELSAIFIEIDAEDVPVYTLHFISDSGYQNSDEKVEQFVKELNKTNSNLSKDEYFILLIVHEIDYELSYSETQKMFYYNFDYLCEN